MKTFRSDTFGRILPLLALVLLASVWVEPIQAQAEPSGAKRLFYDNVTGVTLSDEARKQNNARGRVRVRPNAVAAQPKYSGIHYWIELEGTGAVTDKHTFHTGNRIRLHMRSNVDGYVAIWSFDSSGNSTLIFPASLEAGADNNIKAAAGFALPGFIKFAPPTEDERLLIIFSRTKEDMPKAVKSAAETSNNLARGGKSLVFETEEKVKGQVGTYAVSRDGGPIFAELRLQHRE